MTVHSLDYYCKQRAVAPHLIKVDVEGAELLVLDGAKQLLSLPADRAPVWIIEYSEETYARFGLKLNDLISGLTDAGYRMYRLCPDSQLKPLVTTHINQSCNLVAAKGLLPVTTSSKRDAK